MNQHRKGNSFDAGVPGDPRLLDAINRRTPRGINQQVTSTHAGILLTKAKTRKQPNAKPPLWVTLTQEFTPDPVWKIYAEFGHVVPRHNTSEDKGEPIEISDIPTKEEKMDILVDEKLWVKLTIGVDGKCESAVFEKGTTWPEDQAVQLEGGEDPVEPEETDPPTEPGGTRHIRIAEIVRDPETAEGSNVLICEQLHTGHIDHFQNELLDNTDTTGAGLVQRFNVETGKWMIKRLIAGEGVEIEEDELGVTITAEGGGGGSGNHPWKVTDGGGGTAAINAGFINGMYFYSTAQPWDDPPTFGTVLPESVVLGFGGEYTGGSIAITGTQYIYVETPRNGPTLGYSEALYAQTDNVGVKLADDIAVDETDALVIVASDDPPNVYLSTTGYAAVCIAKVTNFEDSITVDAQYITHNPTVFIPVVNVFVAPTI